MSSLCDLGALIQLKWLSWWLSGKEPTCQCRRHGSGRFTGEGNGYLLWYSCLGNPMHRGSWQATVHGLQKSQTQHTDSITCNPNTGFKTHLLQVSFPAFPALLSYCPRRTFTLCLNSCFSAVRSHFTFFFHGRAFKFKYSNVYMSVPNSHCFVVVPLSILSYLSTLL